MDSATTVKNKCVQMDLLENVSAMLKAIACMEDSSAPRISEIVIQIDSLINDLGVDNNDFPPSSPRAKPPVLTLV